MTWAELVEKAMLTAIGLAVGIGALTLVWRRSAFRWQRLAAVYAGSASAALHEPIPRRYMQNLILVGAGIGYNSHHGVTTFGISETGLSISLWFPFSIFHPPLSIPFDDLSVAPRGWYLNTRSFEIAARRAPEIKLILDGGLLEWIATTAGTRWPAARAMA